MLLRPHTRTLAFLAALLLGVSAAFAGTTRTLTAKDGRSIEVEILGYKVETLRVRRVDTDREFQIPLASLAEADQAAMRRFIWENPELRDTVKPADIRVEFSRAKFERENVSDLYWREEDAEGWGFSVTVLNQTNAPIEGLRVDYIVYAVNDPDDVYSASREKTSAEKLERVTGSEKLDAIPSLQRVSLRTKPVVSRRLKYTDGARMITADGKLVRSWRDKALHGVWLRVYDGDKLVHEASSPDKLRSEATWTSPR